MHFNMRAMPLPSLSFCHIYIQFVIFKDPIGNYASELGFALFLEIYFEIEREIQFLFFFNSIGMIIILPYRSFQHVFAPLNDCKYLG